MRTRTVIYSLLCSALWVSASPAAGDIDIEGTNVGTAYTVSAGDLINTDVNPVNIDAPGVLTMTGGEIRSGGTSGTAVRLNSGAFQITGGQLSGATSVGNGLRVYDGVATIGGSATLTGGTDTFGVGSGLAMEGGHVTVNGGTIYGGGGSSGAIEIIDGQLDVFGGTFHAAINSPGFGLSLIMGGQTNFFGGDFLYELRLINDAELNIYSGQFGDEIGVRDDTVTTIYGSDFTVNGTPIPASSLPYAVPDDNAVIDVTYFDSSTATITTDRNGYGPDEGTVILTNVPEPASVGLLSMGAVACLRRRGR